MKAVMHETFGDPAEVLSPSETERPEPGKGQILVRVTLAPIHNHDLWTIRGTYGVKPPLPATGGSEAVGVVEAVGEGVSDDLMGKRVSVAGLSGAWSDYAVAGAAGAIPLPDEIDDEAGAQLIAMPFSAIALLDSLDLNEGDWLVQTAANGAVGKIMARLCEARGIRLLNLVRRTEAQSELQAMGINPVLTTEGKDWIEVAQEMIGDGGARAAIDSVGGQTGGDLLALIGEGGQIVTFGTATGEPLTLETGPIIFKQATVRGFWAKTVIETMPGDKRERLMTELVTLATQGKLPLDVDETFSLEAPGDAVRAASQPGRKGKVMFRP